MEKNQSLKNNNDTEVVLSSIKKYKNDHCFLSYCLNNSDDKYLKVDFVIKHQNQEITYNQIPKNTYIPKKTEEALFILLFNEIKIFKKQDEIYISQIYKIGDFFCQAFINGAKNTFTIEVKNNKTQNNYLIDTLFQIYKDKNNQYYIIHENLLNCGLKCNLCTYCFKNKTQLVNKQTDYYWNAENILEAKEMCEQEVKKEYEQKYRKFEIYDDLYNENKNLDEDYMYDIKFLKMLRKYNNKKIEIYKIFEQFFKNKYFYGDNCSINLKLHLKKYVENIKNNKETNNALNIIKKNFQYNNIYDIKKCFIEKKLKIFTYEALKNKKDISIIVDILKYIIQDDFKEEILKKIRNNYFIKNMKYINVWQILDQKIIQQNLLKDIKKQYEILNNWAENLGLETPDDIESVNEFLIDTNYTITTRIAYDNNQEYLYKLKKLNIEYIEKKRNK